MILTYPLSALQLVRALDPDSASQRPELSIVVGTYCQELYVEECLDSIVQVPGKYMEILVFDDGSEDGTLAKCINFPFRSDLSVRIYTKANCGVIHSIRCGLTLARGKYVAFISGDDCYLSTGLVDALKVIDQSSPPVDVLMGQGVTTPAPKNLIYGTDMKSFFCMTPFKRLDTLWREPPKPMLLQTAVFRTEFLRSLNPWVDGLELDDWPTFIRVFVAEAHFGAIVRYQPELYLCRYRIHAGGVHMNIDRQMRITEQVAKTFVPIRYRDTCLANARIDNGLIYLYQGEWWKGITIVFSGLFTSPSLPVLIRLGLRGQRFLRKRFKILRQENQPPRPPREV